MLKALLLLLPLGLESAQACVKDTNFQRTHKLFEDHVVSKVSVAVALTKGEFSSGVILDPETILTCAHGKNSEDKGMVILNSNCYPIRSIKIHEEFRNNSVKEYITIIAEEESLKIGITTKNGAWKEDINPKELNYNKITSLNIHDFDGTDLAIIKLEKPLTTPWFAEFYSPEITEQKQAISAGFGFIKKNAIGDTPQQTESLKGHIIGCDVLPEDNGKTLYTQFEGQFLCGEEYFQPKSNNPLAGLLVPGDSGGGLFIKKEGKYYVCGIASSSFCLSQNSSEEDPDYKEWRDYFREKYKETRWPIFNTWIDVSNNKHRNWIEKHMKKNL